MTSKLSFRLSSTFSLSMPGRSVVTITLLSSSATSVRGDNVSLTYLFSSAGNARIIFSIYSCILLISSNGSQLYTSRDDLFIGSFMYKFLHILFFVGVLLRLVGDFMVLSVIVPEV